MRERRQGITEVIIDYQGKDAQQGKVADTEMDVHRIDSLAYRMDREKVHDRPGPSEGAHKPINSQSRFVRPQFTMSVRVPQYPYSQIKIIKIIKTVGGDVVS